ncbi:YIP1 family protein [Paenibacillus cisolokensis]|uniref:YIP1 family protein n=1 Tax=Paenibacillus TaxID=44249 RepID=UPI00071FE413|nr:YIP1 family protein [Paenibacillus sp. 32O-W]ALS25520.1 Yip1 domain-containing protein [Paenibacillus sp. 32O-W]
MSAVLMMRKVMLHPFDFYEDIQQPGAIKWSHPLILVGLTYIVRMVTLYAAGFAYQTREAYQISALQEWIWLVVPWATWCIAHWAVSAIMDGEGKFAEIVYGSAFALVPYTVFMIPITLLTRLLALDESGTITALSYAVYGWVAWLLLLKVKILHDFDLKKTLFIAVLSIIGMLIVWFVGVLLFGLSNQFIQFIFDMVKELRLRA